MSLDSISSVELPWYLLTSPASALCEGGRLHTCIEGRFITVFRIHGKLSAIDSICHHAGGPLTAGPIQEIEELGMTVVLCPWHHFMVDVRNGLKAYQSVEVRNGVPINTGWKIGKMVQRAHRVRERKSDDTLLVQLCITSEPCTSDKDSCSSRCAQSLAQVKSEGPYYNT